MVRDWFYPSRIASDPYSVPPPDMRQTAVQHVQMWAFKDSKLPHAIIATANLTDAMLHDTLDRRKAISDWALRSVYAMAFCRFVNGFVDRDIAKAALRATAATKVDASAEKSAVSEEEAGATTTASRGEGSMYAHAAAIGMPEQFVDLRHRATHEEMPGLEVLREMARRGLDWLWERWWKVHATDEPGRALREREERRLLAERKAEARRLHDVHAGNNASIDDLAAALNKDSRAGFTGQETDKVFADIGKDDAAGLHHQDGKRKRGVHGPDLDTEMISNGHSAKRKDTLARVKWKRGTQPAFGLFEP
jgi:hypothetical protein